MIKNFRKVASGLEPLIEPLLHQIMYPPEVGPPEHRDWWNYDDSWTARKDPRRNAIYNEDNIVLRYVTVGVDHETKKLLLFEAHKSRDEWTRPAAHVFTAFRPLVKAVDAAVYGEHIGRIIITKLPPGGVIGLHTDAAGSIGGVKVPGLPYWQRYQIPLKSKRGSVRWICGNEEFEMLVGNAYWFNKELPHSVHNDSDQDRLSLVFEIRPMFS